GHRRAATGRREHGHGRPALLRAVLRHTGPVLRPGRGAAFRRRVGRPRQRPDLHPRLRRVAARLVRGRLTTPPDAARSARHATTGPRRGMKVGLHGTRFPWPGGPPRMRETLTAVAQRAEAAGFYSLDVMDHLFQIQGVGPAEWDMNEAYTTLGFLDGVTRHLRLG